MAPNVKLRRARVQARLSQGDLALLIREAGFRSGRATPCTERTVQRWESGKVALPQARYLLALEAVLGQPAENLGFDAARLHGMDRDRLLAEAGLDTEMPLPDPAVWDGPLTGIWLSRYEYPSSGRGETFASSHYVQVWQRGAQVTVRSVPASASVVTMDLNINGNVLTGTWAERTDRSGYYQGAAYTGALQMLLDPTGHRMAGKWVGFGRDLDINHGPWTLTLVDAEVGAEAVERWNRAPEDGARNG